MMKSYIWLQNDDGSIQQVEQEVAKLCPIICQEIHTGVGSSKQNPISLPPQVNPAMLSLILDYCQFHQVPGRSNKERKSFDEKFIRMDTKRLCELTSAADSLQLKPLVDLTSRALARMIEGKTPEEIRETFHLPDDLTEEEKLEPLKNMTDDPRIRVLNRLYARKRKELKERDKLKNVEIEEERVDDRSVDDLLSFINGGKGDSKGVKTSKSKKKNRRRKDQQKNVSSNCIPISDYDCSSNNAIEVHTKDSKGLNSMCHVGKIHNDVGEMLKLQDVEDESFAPEDEFDDSDDIDDGIDPAMKEKIDREVEDFARRLNSDWPERMQEILSLSQQRGGQYLISINGNSTARRCASMCSFHPPKPQTRAHACIYLAASVLISALLYLFPHLALILEIHMCGRKLHSSTVRYMFPCHLIAQLVEYWTNSFYAHKYELCFIFHRVQLFACNIFYYCRKTMLDSVHKKLPKMSCLCKKRV
ncbi:SKP1-like protein 21 isoform X2 [Actinidia eriantha]|nr:SKP1-like protein 21 isoform X2 [Actinidia eriantha]XP_057497845.1 SKP1-like protein 21 isoform X2 [Actinidia eriantha]XP_057497846.1 SKP1-like protein 21 isoform X2 [Actinidia eriantha]XP_057497847.1 SKP1-like protein 21 isoform X2 [Actinidia eriantha]